MGPGLPELVARDDEVLAQDRDVDRAAHGVEVVEAAAEAAPLGEHADDGGAAGLVVGGERGRVGDGGERALGRAGPLDLGDDRDAVAARAPASALRQSGRRSARSLSSSRLTRAWRSARSARTPTRMSSSTLTRWSPRCPLHPRQAAGVAVRVPRTARPERNRCQGASGLRRPAGCADDARRRRRRRQQQATARPGAVRTAARAPPARRRTSPRRHRRPTSRTTASDGQDVAARAAVAEVAVRPGRARRAATRSPGRTARSGRGTGRSGSAPARSGRPAPTYAVPRRARRPRRPSGAGQGRRTASGRGAIRTVLDGHGWSSCPSRAATRTTNTT